LWIDLPRPEPDNAFVAISTISAKVFTDAEFNRNGVKLPSKTAYQLRRRREAILERETALRLFVGDRLAEGWTPEQISGRLKSGNERRLRAIGCETIYAFIYRTAQKAEEPCGAI